MGMVEEQSLVMALMSENEGGTAEVLTNPVDERIEDPISNSNTKTTKKTKSILWCLAGPKEISF